jgi:hypothetical protein
LPDARTSGVEEERVEKGRPRGQLTRSAFGVVALAALGGLCFAIRARASRGRKHPGVSSEVSAELIRRADQQNRWALRDDTRGVYGAKGAELMRGISPEPNVDPELDKATANPRTAAVACTPADLATLLADKLPCWRWAAFVSVLVQRRAELESRLYDNQLGYAAPSGERAPGGAEVPPSPPRRRRSVRAARRDR